MGGSGRPPSPQRARRRRSRRRARVAGVQRPRAPQATGAADGAAVALEWPAYSVPGRPQRPAPPTEPPSRSSGRRTASPSAPKRARRRQSRRRAQVPSRAGGPQRLQPPRRSRGGARWTERALDLRRRRPAARGTTLYPASRRLAVDQLAPAPVVLATRLATAPRQRTRRDEQIVSAAPGRGVGGAPAQLDQVTRGVGFGLAGWTVGANDDGGTRLDEVRHVSSPVYRAEILFILWHPSRGPTRCGAKNHSAGACGFLRA
jgi:hypothetical protein